MRRRRPLTLGEAKMKLHPTRRALVVEHDWETCNSIASVLRSDGFEVEVATGGLFLEDRICDCVVDPLKRPDIVITDLRLPSTHGLDLLASIRCVDGTLPVIIVDEATEDQDVRIEAQRMGATAILHKPVDSLTLREAVDVALHVSTPSRPLPH